MENDIKTKPYDLLIELVETRDNHKIRSGLLSSSQLNNLSFELLLFYLMFIIAYLNTDELKKTTYDRFTLTSYLDKTTNRALEKNIYDKYKIKINYDKINPRKYNIHRIALTHQSYQSYKNNDTFNSLYEQINKINKTIKIHKYFINFLLFLYNFIITNNSVSGSRRKSSYRNSLMTNNSIKRLITKIFDIVINFTYENSEGSFIEIDEDLLYTIKYHLYKLILSFRKYGLTSPLQCLEEYKCTDLITLESIKPILYSYELFLKMVKIPIRGGKLTKKRNLKKMIKRNININYKQ